MFDAALNHLLRGESWSRERLKPFAGKTVRFQVPPFCLSLTVTSGGEVTSAAAESAPDAKFFLTPPLLLRLLVRDEAAYKDVEITGDSEFAGEIAYVAKNLRWDAEEDLSRFVGDIAARRLVSAARSFSTWGRQTFDGFSRSFSEYWTEERPLIAKSEHVRQFIAEVDALRDDVERLEKRLQDISPR
ncbi:MAG TPA: SCP2 sterol-binding domain-containing protein [Burkholderiales bacterium]|nr:SCP2 sterol-binding domain-containing protein [Burkholderiales bacterium]